MAISISLIAVVFMLFGLYLYFKAASQKWQEVGRIMFFCGALAVCFGAGSAAFKIG